MPKKELQHTTVIWYGGSCTEDKLMGNSIQVLCNAKVSADILSQAGTVNHAMNNEITKITVAQQKGEGYKAVVLINESQLPLHAWHN